MLGIHVWPGELREFGFGRDPSEDLQVPLQADGTYRECTYLNASGAIVTWQGLIGCGVLLRTVSQR